MLRLLPFVRFPPVRQPPLMDGAPSSPKSPPILIPHSPLYPPEQSNPPFLLAPPGPTSSLWWASAFYAVDM